MERSYTINQIGKMLEGLIDRLAPKQQARWVSGYDLRTVYGLKKSEIERYKVFGLMATRPIKKGSQRLYYDISKIEHILNKKSQDNIPVS